MLLYKDKFQIFLEVTRQLNTQLAIIPTLCGSLGMQYAIGSEDGYVDDIDIVVPSKYAHSSEGRDQLEGAMRAIGFEPVAGGSNFIRDECVVSVGCEFHHIYSELDRFGIDVKEISIKHIGESWFKQMRPEHYLRIYEGVVNIPWWNAKKEGRVEEKIKQLRKFLNRGDVLPAYGQKSLAEVPHTICSLLGVDTGRPTLPEDFFGRYKDRFSKVVLLFVDGLSYDNVVHNQFRPLFKLLGERGFIYPITSVFPSTTAAALTVAHTGLTPAEHGLPEWHVYFSELDGVIETLPFMPNGKREFDYYHKRGVDPEILYSGPTVYTRLAKAGVKPFMMLPENLVGSGYSTVAQRGPETIPYRRASDMFVKLRRKLSEVEGKAYFFVYCSQVDSSGHEFGPHSSEQQGEISTLSHMVVNEFFNLVARDASIVKDTLFVLCSDHGQIRVNQGDVLYLEEEVGNLSKFLRPYEKRKGLIPPTGSPRDVFLHIREGKAEEALEELKAGLEGRAEVLLTKDAINNGLFGAQNASDRFLARAGDILILPHGHTCLWHKGFPKDPKFMAGIHGGLSYEEMTIPFAIAPLENLTP